MPEILFYHLTQSTAEQALPALIERSLARNWRVGVQFADESRYHAMDDHLWTWADDSFIPHGKMDDPFPPLQPVYLTMQEDNPNKADIRFLLDGATCLMVESYTRLVLMFEDRDTQIVENMRTQWITYKQKAYPLTYWQQDENRRWIKKAG